ncbi:restriction endonuclease subunit S [Candidatus Methanosphaera massiliense]|uniref:restriction endonuclease subunit S n=1 Tax=Candidatus Methanosphaera massiliense TaxID=3017187 RepID=UPI002DD6985C|nr:restriction endonuclease subunit S [Candidatus Methanosphaera massiliense]
MKLNKNLEQLAKLIYNYLYIDFKLLNNVKFIDSKIGKIPENWKIMTINEFVKSIMNGGTPKRKESRYWNNGKIPWLKTGEINNNLILDSEEFITEEGLINSSAKLLPINTVIIALYGKGTAARVGLLKTEATTNQACCAMICESYIKSVYLYLFLLNKQKQIEQIANGSVQQNLNKKIIGNLPIIVPPDNLLNYPIFTKIYDVIYNNLKEIKSLEKLRDTLLPKLMSGEIDISQVEL